MQCVRAKYKQQEVSLPLVVVGDDSSLLGRSWLEELCLDGSEIINKPNSRKVHQVKAVGNSFKKC